MSINCLPGLINGIALLLQICEYARWSGVKMSLMPWETGTCQRYTIPLFCGTLTGCNEGPHEEEPNPARHHIIRQLMVEVHT